jgi:cytochrome P450
MAVTAVAAPAPLPTRPWDRLMSDLRYQRGAGADGFPPGWKSFSAGRTQEARDAPLSLILSGYRAFGPVFTLKIFHANAVFMIGPEANHFMTVSGASKFTWRDGSLGDLYPLLGDGLLTIDGDYHRRARRIMLPAFHRDQIAATATAMAEETRAALAGWRDGAQLDVYAWTRALAMRIAMRALLGFDPDHRTSRGTSVAEEFENALSFYGTDYVFQIMRTPGSPFRRMMAARALLDEVVFDEIERRRHAGEQGTDLLSLLLAAEDEDGSRLSDEELRDQIVTLLFAGHDTTTSTVTFLLYELARHPHELAPLQAEIDDVLGGEPPTAAQLGGEAMPRLEMAIEETLRLYPPAWIGPRRAIEDFEFAGHRVAAGAPVNYCSWASHHLPEVFEDPEEFRPGRFAPEARAALPKGAYVPFGGGSRTCIGMRFGQMEIRAIAALILARWQVELVPGWTMFVRQMPTLSPRGGMPVAVRAR